MYTRKNFQEIAEILKNANNYAYPYPHIVEGLCKLFKKNNSNFDKEKFLKWIAEERKIEFINKIEKEEKI